MDENKNIENVEDEATEEVMAETLPEPAVEDIAETITDTAAQAAVKPKSKIFIAYKCALVVFMAIAVTALVCFGLYANNLVHGEDAASLVSYLTEYSDINL